VAKYADGWNIDELSLEDYAKKLEVIRKHCEALGTDYGRIEKTLEQYVLVSSRKEDHQRLADWASMSSQNSMERKRLGKPPHTATIDEVRQDFLIGSVDEIIEKVSRYIDIGVQRFMIYFMDFPSFNSVLPFAKGVFPSVQ
jgi:alkanesulfonate monooxygenase SsuD/methylene tetrahydromethanopterin reductase-like flavin-dependent oxidoreductase (luciferase family)